MKKSTKQISLEKLIYKNVEGKSAKAADLLFHDKELQALQDYANIVSIKRLGFNDHGPVHMRKAALNAIIMLDLLTKANIKLNMEKERLGTADDSKVAVLLASLLHDIGMTVSRDKHEFISISLALPIIERILKAIYRDDISKIVIVRSLTIEGIYGHMATQTINTLEAGLVLIGDGCDMENGRARIPQLLSDKPKVGDIHRYSSMSIQSVSFTPGSDKPIRIQIDMSQSVGIFQVEEVLFPKILSSPVKRYIELYAGIKGKELLRYL
ncbi:MAG: phosphohydrolase [Candidatus Cloacimonetes bacterium]|nr:phosphohydrolase [Candidatus Cloacimonadota bacterium]